VARASGEMKEAGDKAIMKIETVTIVRGAGIQSVIHNCGAVLLPARFIRGPVSFPLTSIIEHDQIFVNMRTTGAYISGAPASRTAPATFTWDASTKSRVASMH
jgi:hypothetical protein